VADKLNICEKAPSAAKAAVDFAGLTARLKPLPFKAKSWGWLAVLALLWALPLVAQIQYGNLNGTAAGQISTGYSGGYGNLETGTHSWDVGGTGTINGYYYNPQFLSFSAAPYYGRSQDNSDSQSITDASGYSGTLNLFNGSHFPGFVSFNQNWNSSGMFGLPGVAGLTTKGDGHGVNVGWSALLPNLPTLTLGFSDNSGSSSLLGSDSTSASTSRNFSAGSTYQIAGFYLNGGFNHVNTDANISGLLENGAAEASNDSSNNYRLGVSRALPFLHSSFSLGYGRSSYSGESDGSQESGTTDTVNANLSLGFPRLPVTVTANYNDNVFGAFQQQLINNGQAPVAGLASPESHSLTLAAITSYTLLPRLVLNGYVDHTEQYFNGQNFGLTQFGIGASYNFLHRIKGLTFSVGMVDNAMQEGNTRVGFIGNVDYHRAFGRWEIESFFRYDQDVETLLVIYSTSQLNYGASIKRDLGHGLHWVGIANATRSVFEQLSGDGSRAESFTTMLIAGRVSVSGYYSQSKGTSVLTASGLIPTPLPGQEISPSNLIVYNGTSEGGSARFNPTQHLGFTGSYSRSYGNTVGPLLLSNSSTTNYYGLATYQLRKMMFTSGFTKFRQDISSSGTPPGVVTSYYFGVTRWFKGF